MNLTVPRLDLLPMRLIFFAFFIRGVILSPRAHADILKQVYLTPLKESICGAGYISVPKYTLPSGLEVPTFCVMKFEAKQSGIAAISVAEGTPWVNVTWQAARAACAAGGGGLISENQWLSIAHQVVSVESNWTSGVTGIGVIYSGHNDNAPPRALAASTDDNDGYYGTVDSFAKPGDGAFANFPSNDARAYAGQRRTLMLPSHDTIWDLAGNVWEYVDETIVGANRLNVSLANWARFYDGDDAAYSTATDLPIDKKPPSAYHAGHNMGRYYPGIGVTAYNSVSEAPDNCTAKCATTAVFIRGGRWGTGSNAGVFALGLNEGRSFAGANIGFRCTRSSDGMRR